MIAYQPRRTRRAMRTGWKRLLTVAGFGLATMLAACQGNLGSGSGLSIPQQQPYGQPGGPGGAGSSASQSRQRALDGAVYLTKDATEIPLPTLNGYGVTLALGTPTPTPSPTPLATATANATSSPAAKRRRKKSRARETSRRRVADVTDVGTDPEHAPKPADRERTRRRNLAVRGGVCIRLGERVGSFECEPESRAEVRHQNDRLSRRRSARADTSSER
jgi:hypothetical protein